MFSGPAGLALPAYRPRGPLRQQVVWSLRNGPQETRSFC